MSKSLNRRNFNKTTGALLLSCLIGGKTILLSPAEAASRKISFTALTPQEGERLNLLANVIVPGAAVAGLAHYIDHQLSAPPEQNMLLIRYLRVPPPFDGFYHSALKAFAASVQAKYKKAPEELSEQELHTYAVQMSQENPADWGENAPPAPFFYFVLRSDAIDVTYGTMAGFEKLDIPYLAHIEPQEGWS